MSHPWQERDDRGYPRAFVETVWAVLRSPRSFFAETSGSRGLSGPLLFGVAALLHLALRVTPRPSPEPWSPT
ncbi:MAG: hypothetical protein R3190_00680 [Thermoanaerobaculia bacterium]|nr:hypothetical protein [Thermoanaerobaculia bacterium]